MNQNIALCFRIRPFVGTLCRVLLAATVVFGASPVPAQAAEAAPSARAAAKTSAKAAVKSAARSVAKSAAQVGDKAGKAAKAGVRAGGKAVGAAKSAVKSAVTNTGSAGKTGDKAARTAPKSAAKTTRKARSAAKTGAAAGAASAAAATAGQAASAESPVADKAAEAPAAATEAAADAASAEGPVADKAAETPAASSSAKAAGTRTAAAGAQKRVVFLPFHIEAPDLPNHLQGGLAQVLASRVANRARITAITQGEGAGRMQEALRSRDFSALGRMLADSGADMLVLSDLRADSGQYGATCHIFSRDGGAPRKVSRLMANMHDPLAAVEDLALDVSRVVEGKDAVADARQSDLFSGDNPERAWRREALSEAATGLADQEGEYRLVESLRGRPIDLEAQDMNIGDVDGDGEQDLVILGKKRLEIYRYANSRFVKKAELDLPGHLNHLVVSLADANQNGVPELYIGSSNGDLPASSIYEWQGGKPVKLADNIPHYLNAVPQADGSAMLLGQSPPPNAAGGGKIFLMRLEEGKIVPSENTLPVPEDYNIYDVLPADLDGDGALEIVAFNRANRLQVFRGGELAWTSSDEYGAGRNFYGTLSSVSGKDPIYLHTRIALADMDQDGLPEVMVAKNQLGKVSYIPSIRYFEGASLAGLKWEDQGLRLLWETRPLSGYAAGYQTQGLSGKEGRMQLFLAEVVDAPFFQFWTSPKTVLHRFVLEGR